MNMHEFSKRNAKRCTSEKGFNQPLNHWTLSDWMMATVGELGEAANVAKKLKRAEDGIPGNGDATPACLRQQLADELADTYIYLDLLAQSQGINLPNAIEKKFSATSAKIGYAE